MAKKMRLEAHRGVGTNAPENTMPAFELAVAEGYDMIELDLKFTADDCCVVLHDGDIARTARTRDGERVENAAISALTLSELRERGLDFGIWKGEAFRGTPIPTFAEVLTFAKGAGIPLKIDNCYERFTREQHELLYRLIEEADMGELIGFTCASTDSVAEIAARFPKAEVHYDGVINSERVEALKRAAEGHRTTVWIPMRSGATSWVSESIRRASAEYVDELHAQGFEVGIWILHSEEEYAAAVEYGADIIETDGALKPQ